MSIHCFVDEDRLGDILGGAPSENRDELKKARVTFARAKKYDVLLFLPDWNDALNACNGDEDDATHFMEENGFAVLKLGATKYMIIAEGDCTPDCDLGDTIFQIDDVDGDVINHPFLEHTKGSFYNALKVEDLIDGGRLDEDDDDEPDFD